MYNLFYLDYFLVATSNRQASWQASSNETALVYFVCIAFQNIIIIHSNQMFES